MQLLLDTCTFIWSATSPRQLSPTAASLIEDPANALLLSPVSIWEMCTKALAGKLVLKPTPADYIETQRIALGVLHLPFDNTAAMAVLSLPQIHKDPFDRMLITQALAHNLTLLTPDPLIRQYPVSTLW
jgi:PIN domain nuclease of toxin-antitoxin system